MTQLARPDLARSRSGRNRVRPASLVPAWVVGTASLGPAVLVGGWLVAGALQLATYSPMGQTISALAGQTGTDRWVMTAALLVVGGCQVATGAGLAAVRLPARILLILTGLSTLGIAATRNWPRARRRATSPSR